MNELALFAGAGGGLLASKWLLGRHVICYAEIDRYCQAVLQARIQENLLDDAPLWDDVRSFDGKPWSGLVDIVTAGFPCQPFSVAGRMWAAKDNRNLWPDTIRIVREVRPIWVFLENVGGIRSFRLRYAPRIFGELAEAGYDAEWDCVSASDCGAPHKRERMWILANADGNRKQQSQGNVRKIGRRLGNRGQAVSDAAGAGCAHVCGECSDAKPPGRAEFKSTSWWDIEPPLGRMVNGLADRVGQLKAIGNGQVPIVAATAYRMLRERF